MQTLKLANPLLKFHAIELQLMVREHVAQLGIVMDHRTVAFEPAAASSLQES